MAGAREACHWRMSSARTSEAACIGVRAESHRLRFVKADKAERRVAWWLSLNIKVKGKHRYSTTRNPRTALTQWARRPP